LIEGIRQSVHGRRQAYLAAALELRKMAYQAHSSEMQQAFMRLAVLYEELAEYAVKRVGLAQSNELES
jgi:hypothetical protein